MSAIFSSLRPLRGAAQMLGDGFDAITAHVQSVHRAIAATPFDVLARIPGVGMPSRVTRGIHDGIGNGVYATVRGVGAGVFALIDTGLRLGERGDDGHVEHRPRLDAIASACAGVFGDHMARRRNPLTPRMRFYAEQQPLTLGREHLAATWPQAPARIAIFVHGLACNESAWSLYADRSQPYPQRLRERGYACLRLRYNTGLAVDGNGRRLARMIERLWQRWPGPVDEIVLLGHSMGGLVIRAACEAGVANHMNWTRSLRHVFCLGSPHLGAPLAKTVATLRQVLHVHPLAAVWGELLDYRSRGICDLQGGLGESGTTLPGLPAARIHLIASGIGSHARDPRTRLLGDGLVRLPSAFAGQKSGTQTTAVFARHHMQLLNDDAVFAHLAAVLDATIEAR